MAGIPVGFAGLLFKEPLPDITSNRHVGNPESVAANADVHKYKAIQRELIMRVFLYLSPNGRICEEIEVATGFSHQSCSARISELKRDGSLIATGERRRTTGGSTAAAVPG